MNFDLEILKQLREETGAGVMDVKAALESASGDVGEARKFLHQKGLSKAAKRDDRETNEGLVFSYIHQGSKIGSLVMLTCETDFVAKTEDFSRLAKDIAMQVATSEYDSLETLMSSPFIKDENKSISDLITQVSAKTGEKVELKKFVRFVI